MPAGPRVGEHRCRPSAGPARNVDFNTVLGTVCAEFAACRFDGNRVFDHTITAVEVSIVDFFHPSMEGLRNLAETTWNGGYWADV